MPPKVKKENSSLQDASSMENSGENSLNASLGISLSNSSSTTSGSTDFVKKLFLMLEDNAYESVVTWTKAGDSFVVLDTNEFTKEILPKHFKHSNFASFVRQLNKYDFHKVKQSNEEKQKNEYGDAAWEFKHPDFRKHDREALETIKRKGPVQKRPLVDENHDQSVSKLEETVMNLTNDYSRLQEDMKLMNQRYTNVLESIITMKSVNDRYFRSINTLVSALVNNGIKLPQLDLPNPDLMSQLTQRSQPPSQPQSAAILQQSIHNTPPNSTQSLPTLPVQITQQVPQQVQQQQGQGQATQGGGQPQQIKLDHKYHVLLVEDDNVCIQLCTKFLEKIGCSVEIVSDGLTAISALEKGRYDIVFMDIIMPNLDGATATSIVRSFDSLTPIIAMTGNIEGSDLVTYLQHGMSDILAKPFTKDDLYQMLHKHLNSRTPIAYQPGPGAQSLGPDDHLDKRQKI